MESPSPNIKTEADTVDGTSPPDSVTPLAPLETEAANSAQPGQPRRSPFAVLRRARVSGLVAGGVVVALVGIIVTIYLTKNPKHSNTTAGDALSNAALQKLSLDSTGTGNSTQTLTFHSPTTFDDTLKVVGTANFRDLVVTGVLSPSNLEIGKNLQVDGASALQGDVATKGQLNVGTSLSVAGTSAFGGNATFNGNGAFAGSLSANSLSVKTASIGGLTFGHIITTGSNPTGTMAIASGGGSVVISGNDTSGTITFTLGSSPHVGGGDMVTLNFRTAFSSTPHINLTPVGASSAGAQYYVTRSVNAFVIGIINPSGGAQYIFDYLVTQ